MVLFLALPGGKIQGLKAEIDLPGRKVGLNYLNDSFAYLNRAERGPIQKLKKGNAGTEGIAGAGLWPPFSPGEGT